jgi:hypothetical protein
MDKSSRFLGSASSPSQRGGSDTIMTLQHLTRIDLIEIIVGKKFNKLNVFQLAFYFGFMKMWLCVCTIFFLMIMQDVHNSGLSKSLESSKY